MCIMRFLSIFFLLATLFPVLLQASPERFSEGALFQVGEFVKFYKDDPKVLADYRLIENLCRKEDDQAEIILGMLHAARSENPRNAKQIDAIKEKFLLLIQNDLTYIQDIFLYQLSTGKRFDLNFFHNLSVRSALNAIRLTHLDIGNAPEYAHQLMQKFRTLRSDMIPSDQQLVPPEKLEASQKKYAEILSRIQKEEENVWLAFDDLDAFSSFYEVTLTFYPTEYLKRFHFFDHYDFMQYLLFYPAGGGEPNGFYSKGPFNLSRMTADLTKPDQSKPVYLLTVGSFAPPRQKETALAYRGNPLEYLASLAYRKFDPSRLPREVQALYLHLSRKYNAKSKKFDDRVSDQVLQNRIYALAVMNEQDFYQRYRNIKNDSLFFDYARKKLSLSRLKSILQQEYTLPGGDITLPRFELMGYGRDEFLAEQDASAILKRIPDVAHIEFIRPLILEIFSQLTDEELKKAGSQRVGEIAERFGSPVGRTGDKALYDEFFAIFGPDIWNGAVELARQAGIRELDAFKWMAILLTIESRGNMFAVSPTGALGPLQHTYYFYFKTQPASIPFDAKKSALKTGREFARYYQQYQSIEKAIVCYHDGPAVMQKANASPHWRERISPAADKYIRRFADYWAAVETAGDYREVVLRLRAAAF